LRTLLEQIREEGALKLGVVLLDRRTQRHQCLHHRVQARSMSLFEQHIRIERSEWFWTSFSHDLLVERLDRAFRFRRANGNGELRSAPTANDPLSHRAAIAVVIRTPSMHRRHRETHKLREAPGGCRS